jgi:hypothetical protein
MVELDGLYEALRDYEEREFDTPLTREEFDHDIFLEREKGIPIGVCYSTMSVWNEDKFGNCRSDGEIDVQVNIDTENLNAYVEIPEYLDEFTDKKKVVIYQFDDDEQMNDFIKDAVFEDWYNEGCSAIRKAIGDE